MARKRRPKPEAAPEPAVVVPPAAAATRGRGLWIGALMVLVLAVLGGLWFARSPAPAGPAPEAVSTTLPPASYVANTLCVGCHQAAGDAWSQSHHAKAMAPPTEQTVRGNFDNTQFRHQGVTTRFFRRGDKYMVHTDGPDGRMADFEVAFTFGHEPLQQYLIDTGKGRLQPLQIAWNTREGKWFHLLPNEKAPPGDVLHWTGRYQTGNTMCIACHTTGFDKRYDAQADSFASRWAEVNVSCQSCHGPGSRHAEWAQRKASGQAAAPIERHGLLADLKTPKAQVEACAACHSRRAELSAAPVPGQPHLDHYLPSLLREGLYHADGQQLDEVFVVGSFRQSKMYRMGVSCTNCHDPHSAKPKLQGNALCLQCHQPQANPAFPSAVGQYDSPQHHHHPAGTPGAQCTACHMPAKNYMVIQPRPDHSMRIPRPDLSVKLGTPNACNQCHDDKSAQWAADAITRWVGTPKRPPHYGEAFTAARRGAAGSAQALAALAADKAQPPIVRATALDLLRSNAAIGIDERLEATRDGDAEVRAAAAASLEPLPASMRVPALAPLLKDPLRAVRIAAARSLASLPADQFDAPTRAAYDAALAEYIAAQSVALDMPGNQLNLAVVYGLTRPRRPGRIALPEGAGHRPRLHAGPRQPGAAVQHTLAQCRCRARAARRPAAAAAAGRAAVFAGPAAGRTAAPARSRRRTGQGRQAAAAARAGAIQLRACVAAAGPTQAGRSRVAAGTAHRSRRRGHALCAGGAVRAGRPARQGAGRSRKAAAVAARRPAGRPDVAALAPSHRPDSRLRTHVQRADRRQMRRLYPAHSRPVAGRKGSAARGSASSVQNFDPAIATPASRPFCVRV